MIFKNKTFCEIDAKIKKQNLQNILDALLIYGAVNSQNQKISKTLLLHTFCLIVVHLPYITSIKGNSFIIFNNFYHDSHSDLSPSIYHEKL